MALGNPFDLFNTTIADKANAQLQAGYTNAGNTLQQGYGNARNDATTNSASGVAAWSPYLQMGQTLSPQLTSLLTGGPQALQTLQGTPGYQFGLDQGLNATAAKMQQMGYGGSGNEALALNNYAQDRATQNYDDVVNNIIKANQQGVSGASGTAGLYQNLGTQLSGLDTSLAGNLANLALGSANANAQATQAQYGADTNMANLLKGGAGLAATLYGAFS
jgi:hypothetical protein